MNQIHKEKRHSGLIVAISAVAALLCANVAYACPPGGPDGNGPYMQRMADELKLTDQQRQQFDKIHNDSREEGKSMHEAMRMNHDAMRKLDPAASDYHKRLAALAEEKGELVKQMTIHRGEVRARMHAILTPEQRKIAAELKKNGRKEGSGRRGPGGPGEGGCFNPPMGR
ncbi:periplasmic heavy metal sensor [Mariprofundus erugo]|uniref:Periplasmic heavy metal sensor n=1 Tax=Mariprofundus erugo TaxID=2528639 RepID=A0A5R9GRY9_9PROT|nr:Spy/CpxP family protein refolding chaperone [Mariprofundus erugo]TLS67203.1 periplasmic heavy metal sensor [Mariprofundus erugo]